MSQRLLRLRKLFFDITLAFRYFRQTGKPETRFLKPVQFHDDGTVALTDDNTVNHQLYTLAFREPVPEWMMWQAIADAELPGCNMASYAPETETEYLKAHGIDA